MHNNRCLGADLYSVGTQGGNLHRSSVTTNRVTFFILRANTGTALDTAREAFIKGYS